MQFTHIVEIEVPPERVFECLADPRRHAAWQMGTEDVSLDGPFNPADPQGARYTQRIREGRRTATYQGTIMAFERPTHFTVRLGNGQYALETEYHLARVGTTSTCVAITTTLVEGAWWTALLARLARPLTARLVRQQGEALRVLAERGGCAETT